MNFEKSVLHCSPNTPRYVINSINAICGSPVSDNLGDYLGMPLIQSRVTKSTYAGIVDKVQKKLTSWKSKVISMFGKTTLIQAVTSIIPSYAMQTIKLPVSICVDLDKLKMNFFYGVTLIKRNMSISVNEALFVGQNARVDWASRGLLR